jgi:hypothetical protein
MSSWRFDLSRRRRHDLLAPHRRQDGDAEVHLLALAELELDAPVLRQTALGDVELTT